MNNHLNLENSKTLSTHNCCKSLSRWMMCFLQKNQHFLPSWFSLPTMKSNTQVVGMNATLTRWRPCCIPNCWRAISHSTSSWTKGPSGGVWTTFSNAYNSTWWPCSYKCNGFPSMPTKPLYKILIFMHLTFSNLW
jgi:hypothetical protein